jgi:RHS repeat-associated protein
VIITNGYNNAGQLASVGYSDAITPPITIDYDRLDRPQTITQTLSGQVVSTTALAYNEAGGLLSEANTSGLLGGLSVTNGFDSLWRRTAVALNSQPASLNQFFYGSASRMEIVSNGAISVIYAYLTNASLVDNITFRQNDTTRMVTSKSYDNLNRLKQISSTAGGATVAGFDYQYNDANQRTRTTLADNGYWNYEHDALGQVTAGKRFWQGGLAAAGQQFEYSFDDIGNRKWAKVNGRQANYGPNLLNQYTNRVVPGFVDIIGEAHSNATVTVNLQPVVRQGEYFWKELALSNTSAAVYQSITNIGVLNNGTNADIISTNIGSLFLAKTPELFTHDLDGNLTSDGQWTNIWDAENRLVQVESLAAVPDAAKLKLSFAYDWMNRRIQKVVYAWNGTNYVAQATNKFIWDEWNVLAELDHTNGLIRAYVWGMDLSGSLQGAGGVGGLLAVNATSNGVHFPCSDGNGNVAATVDASNSTVSARFDYGPFAETIGAYGPMAPFMPIRFSTKYHDEETSFYYYGQRYLEDGRWLSRDPIEETGGLNLYGFLANDPIGQVDPFGNEILIIAGRYKVGATGALLVESYQSNWEVNRFANQVRRAFQKIIGDCARIKLEGAGTDTIRSVTSKGWKSIERNKYRLTFSDEKSSCKCDDCWDLLKNAINSSSPIIQFRYLIDRDNAFAETTGGTRDVYINPRLDVELPEQTSKGYRDKRVPFPVVAWHEGIGHSFQGFGHPNIPANHASTWDGVYVDPTIQEENRARNCTRLLGKKFGGIFGLFGRSVGDRIPTYYQ